MNFDLIDEILELEPRKSVVAKSLIKRDEPYFSSHFPGFPIVPGVLITEMMGQAAAKCLDIDRESRGKAVLARIKNAQFRDWVRPEQSVMFAAEILSDRPEFATAACKASVGERAVATAELMFAFVPPDDLPPSVPDRALQAYLERSPSAAGAS